MSTIESDFTWNKVKNNILTKTLCFPKFSDLVAQRGERLELLIDKTENLVDSVSMEYNNLKDVKNVSD